MRLLICAVAGMLIHIFFVTTFELGLFTSSILGVWLAIAAILAACLWEWEDYDGGTPA